MLPNACRNTFVYVLWKKNKTFVILLRSASNSKWIWIVSLLGFIPLWCNDAGNLLWYFALNSILGVFLQLIIFNIFPVADADCVFFHRASPVGTCFTDPHWKGTFLLENFLMIFIFKSYLCLIIIYIVFDYHAYSDKYPSGRRRIWVNIILQSSQTTTKM